MTTLMLERRLARSAKQLERMFCSYQMRSRFSTATVVLRSPILSPQPRHRSPNPLSPKRRHIHDSRSRWISILEESDKAKSTGSQQPQEPTPLSEDEYHERSDAFIEGLLEKLEAMAEEKEDMDVEFSAGVLTVVYPPAGTYVLNKQPPNLQLWLSSPVSGPKRFNWVVMGDSMEQKGGTGGHEWVYLKDGTTLSELLQKELNVRISAYGEDMSD